MYFILKKGNNCLEMKNIKVYFYYKLLASNSLLFIFRF